MPVRNDDVRALRPESVVCVFVLTRTKPVRVCMLRSVLHVWPVIKVFLRYFLSMMSFRHFGQQIIRHVLVLLFPQEFLVCGFMRICLPLLLCCDVARSTGSQFALVVIFLIFNSFSEFLVGTTRPRREVAQKKATAAAADILSPRRNLYRAQLFRQG